MGKVQTSKFLTFNLLNLDKMIFFLKDEPTKPKDVEVVDWDKDHADLKWTKPDNDGGAPITGYIIEYKVREKYLKLELLCFLIRSHIFNL